MLEIYIETLDVGEVKLIMPIVGGIYTNVYGFVHGGSLFTLVDSAMGIACLTTGNLVVTSDTSIRFITNAKKGSVLTAYKKNHPPRKRGDSGRSGGSGRKAAPIGKSPRQLFFARSHRAAA